MNEGGEYRLLCLKAHAYDLISQIESLQSRLRDVNRQIAEETSKTLNERSESLNGGHSIEIDGVPSEQLTSSPG